MGRKEKVLIPKNISFLYNKLFYIINNLYVLTMANHIFSCIEKIKIMYQ